MVDTNSIQPNTVTVLIGPNSSGKSRLLRKLCASCLQSGDSVLAIAPTIFDRFREMPVSGLKFYGARQGRPAAANVFRSALSRAVDKPKIVKNLTQALKYTKFEPVVGIRLLDVSIDNYMAGSDYLDPNMRESLKSMLFKWQNQYGSDGVVKISLDSYSFEELDAISFAEMSRYENHLKKTKAVSKIEYYLYRGRDQIPLLEACSGEICFITTIAFIATRIERRSVIAIDEPETSLHPTWQKDYVETLLDLFHHHEPRILISTHSPIIISGAEAARGNISVYEMDDEIPTPFKHMHLSLEEMYDRLFGLITPKNHYLSQRAVSMINALDAGDRTLAQIIAELEEFRRKSYDESQKLVITRLEAIARQLESIKKG